MKPLLTLFLILSLCNLLAAQSVSGSPQSTDQVQSGYRYFDVTPSPIFWGVKSDFELGFRLFDGLDTALWARAGGAYGYGFFGALNYYRTPQGLMYYAPDYPSIDPTQTFFNEWNMQWGAGIEQGLHFSKAKDRNDVSLLLAYRGWWDNNILSSQPGTLLAQSPIPDAAGDLTNSFLADVLYDGTSIAKDSKVVSGSWVDTSVEYAPLGLSTPVQTGYVQFSASGKKFVPLYTKVYADGLNAFSVYFAGYLAVDYIRGLGSDATQGIPFHVSQSIGGRYYVVGMGGQVRGLTIGYLDGAFKTVANLELRASLPAIFTQDIVPGAVIYFDAGYFANPPGLSQSAPLSHGFVSSAGFGLDLDLLDILTVAFYSDFLIAQPNFDGKTWVPVSLEFGLHF